MKEEVEKGVKFLCGVFNRDRTVDQSQMDRFHQLLVTLLCERFHNHWYPENPDRGQAYRCMRSNLKQGLDESLRKAFKDCNIDYSKLYLPREFSLWIDPGSVSCRLGENSHYFAVKEEPPQRPPSGGKAKPELVTSDYHSESPSSESPPESPTESPTLESFLEDEGSVKKGAVTPAAGKSQPAGSKQGPQYFYMPNPLWVPFNQQFAFLPAYQHLAFYYYDVNSTKPPAAAKTRNPSLVKRLTKRAARC